MDKKIFRIVEVMKNKGLSETKVAELAKISQKTVNNMLAGRTKKPNLQIIEKIQNLYS